MPNDIQFTSHSTAQKTPQSFLLGLITFIFLQFLPSSLAAIPLPQKTSPAGSGPGKHVLLSTTDQRNHADIAKLERASQAAAQRVDSVKYDFSMRYMYWMSPDTNTISGTAQIVRAAPGSKYDKYFRLTYTYNGKEIEYLYNGGDTVLTLLHYKKTAFLLESHPDNIGFTNREANDKAILNELFDGLRLNQNSLPLNSFDIQNPAAAFENAQVTNQFDDSATSLKMFSGSLFNKEEPGQKFSIWFDGPSMHPFRLEEIFESMNQTSYRLLEITRLEINPSEALSPSINDYAIPAGYAVSNFMDMTAQIKKSTQTKAKLISPGTSAPAFAGELLEGGNFALTPADGQVYLLDFWFVNCPPCHQATPHLKKMHKQFKDKGLKVIGINRIDNSESGKKLMRNIIDKSEIPYPQVLGTETIEEPYGISGYPTFILIDQKGRVDLGFSGYSEDLMQGLYNRVESLLNKPD